jgi:hypothetical protein
MPWVKKGDKRPPGAGRKKGTPNKSTKELKEFVQFVFERQLPRLCAKLDEVAERSPEKYSKLVLGMYEYFVPKQVRAEITADISSRTAEEYTDAELAAIIAQGSQVEGHKPN